MIRTGRAATPEEIAQIVEQIAAAPFNPTEVRVRPVHRRFRHLDRSLSARESSLTYHLALRVVAERQWPHGTTASECLADLRRSVRLDSARLAVYERRGGHIAIAVTPTEDILSRAQRGTKYLPNLLVVYSADRGIILSGYQFSDLASTGVPKEAQWLR